MLHGTVVLRCPLRIENTHTLNDPIRDTMCVVKEKGAVPAYTALGPGTPNQNPSHTTKIQDEPNARFAMLLPISGAVLTVYQK